MLTIILPAYNEEENLENTVTKIQEEMKNLHLPFELLIINDASTDSTLAIAERLKNSDINIKVISHPQNRGPGSGIVTGIANATGDLLTFIPADLAMDMKEIKKYLDAAKNADVVIGLRSDRSDYSVFRKFVSVVNIMMIKVLFNMKEKQFNYIHMYHTKIFEKFKPETNGVFITAEIMIKAKYYGFKIAEVNINYLPRVHGKATCGKPSTITKTVKDMFKFWFKWTFSSKK